jgi:hypothetical protein
MATLEIITLTDSLDPRISNGVETVTFFHPVFGTKHEIELSEKNREHFMNHLSKLDKYIDASRDVTPEPVVTVPTVTSAKSDLTAVREWARANGYTVGDRGRIKAEIQDAYHAAQTVSVPVAPADVDFGDVIDEVDSRQDEAEASADAFDKVNGTDDTPSELDDAAILAMMAEIHAESGTVTLEQLAEKVDSSS